ncbi:MAG: M24 family metallopeptidase [Dehalococcoidia bacterium]|nr:M24 family metallopeptidase [Dehalococcoidia bacterium]MDZ4246732.1 M24 family metallopeptidase [Dehalococcoidia bacterium]
MVKMASKLTFGTTQADWQERINTSRLRDERAARMRQIMKKHGLSVILSTGSDNNRYLTGLRGAEFTPQLWYILFFAEDDPVVFAHAGWVRQMPDQAPWIKHWRIARAWLGGICGPEAVKEEAALFASEIYQELCERGLGGEKLGVIGFDGAAREALTQKGIKLADGVSPMREARVIKTIDEINCLKMVAAICEAAWYKLWENMKPGTTDADLSLVAINALYQAGAEIVPPIGIRSGPVSFDRGFERAGRIIQTGDLVYAAMCGVRYMGYGSCNYRTFVAGRNPTDKEKDWYKTLLERLNNIIDSVKPGATTADAAKHFPPASHWGYKEEAEVLTMEIGHGIGIGSYELPVINRQWSLAHPQVFQPGMTFAVESREGETRVGGVRLENMILVTENGAELLDHFPREEILVAGRY